MSDNPKGTLPGVMSMKARKLKTCKYCGITTNPGSYKRFHGVNCLKAFATLKPKTRQVVE